LATLAPLEDLLWFYEELESKDVENIIEKRLKAGERIKESSRSSYGKLMERILLFRERQVRFAPLLLPYAEEKLASIHIPHAQTVVAVLGDSSGSMQVAVKCAATLGSLLCAVLKADLSFFHTVSFAPPVVPRTVKQVLEVVEKVKADGGTSMAAALYPFYMRKQRVDLFVLVSDEGENTEYDNHLFAGLFKKYQAEVHPTSKVILVSFLKVGEIGVIKQRLEEVGIDALQFRLDGDRPDTSKFDSLLGLISLETEQFQERHHLIERILTKQCKLPSVVFQLIIDY